MSTGPDERTGRGHLRAGHADREQVIAELKAAFVQGCLDQGELEERAGRAVAARTYAELAALTADLPAGLASGPAPAAGSTPGRTLARAARRTGVCLLAAAVLLEAAFLAGNFLLIVAATFVALGAAGFLGYGIIDALQEQRARRRLTSGHDPGQGGTGSAGGPDARGPHPSGRRDDPTRAEARAMRPEARARRPAVRALRPGQRGGLQRGWAVS